MRLPIETDPSKIDVALFGVPFDSTVTYRPGARFGPRDIRVQSALIRPYNPELRIDPFSKLKVADIGDVETNPLSVDETIASIFKFVDTLCSHNVVPIAIGGDHTITLPILRAMKKKHGPVAVIHFDAHTDTWDDHYGVKLSHGTWLRRAMEEGLVQGDKTFQIGLRGQLFTPNDFDFAISQGFHQITSEEIKKRGVEYLVEQLEPLGGSPVYVSLDIDWIDPAFAPGTGVPQVGGPDSYEALQAIRGLKGLNIVGADVVEVCPAYDSGNITSVLAANLLYEILCVLPRAGQG